jgi:hypothetical protein
MFIAPSFIKFTRDFLAFFSAIKRVIISNYNDIRGSTICHEKCRFTSNDIACAFETKAAINGARECETAKLPICEVLKARGDIILSQSSSRKHFVAAALSDGGM